MKALLSTSGSLIECNILLFFRRNPFPSSVAKQIFEMSRILKDFDCEVKTGGQHGDLGVWLEGRFKSSWFQENLFESAFPNVQTQVSGFENEPSHVKWFYFLEPAV